MQVRMKMVLSLFLPFLALVACMPQARGQASSRVVGTIAAISGNTLTVKTDAGTERQVLVPASAAIKRVAPGQKDLSTAQPIQFSDLTAGDRVLIKLSADSSDATPQAAQIIAIKQEDVAARQQKEREDWQRRSVGGLVKTVDASSGTITIGSGLGATAKTIAVHTGKSTILKRYAPASVRYDDARPAPIDAIHAGDQLRARGQKSADGASIDAEEIVSGSFRNISGVIASLDSAASTFMVKDLATKKPVTVHITPDAQMRRLPDATARMIAARLKSSGGGSSAPAQPQQGYVRSGNGSGGNAGDPQQMLNRLPQIQLADLKKGDAVMLVSTDGAADVTAITLLAGVEPLLEAPAASQNMLSNWSLGGSGQEGGVQ